MIDVRLYLYDSSQEANAYRGKDFSKHISLGAETVADLTEVLDTANITLTGLEFRDEFAPETKFILEFWERFSDQDEWQLYDSWHLCVENDTVSQPILSDDEYFDHHISFNEASVVAQKRLVDNIAVTYKLKDVTLDGTVTVDKNAKANCNLVDVDWTPTSNFGGTGGTLSQSYGHRFYWRFPTWVDQELDRSKWENLAYYQEISASGEPQRVVSLPLPMLEIQSAIPDTKNFKKQGFCSVDVEVVEQNLLTQETKTLIKKTVQPSSQNDTESFWVIDDMQDRALTSSDWRRNFKGWTTNGFYIQRSGTSTVAINVSKIFALYDNEQATSSNRSLTFTIYPNRSYKINIVPHNYTGNYKVNDYLTFVGDDNPLTFQFSRDSYPTSVKNSYINSEYPVASLEFVTYLEGTDSKIWLKSAPEENAYNLFQKAQLTTQDFDKISGTNVVDTPVAFYLQDKDKESLLNTRIIENFYNQKNLWELFLDIGKYIHAIPKVKFGKDDRFLVEWEQLGRTDEQESAGTPMSIFNSRDVEDYISAVSSYVTNMVQLGGIIDEWVAPKSTSDEFLVYNDVAEIIVSKPIIEIVDLQVKNVASSLVELNSVKDLAGVNTTNESTNGYIFEENVYSLLPINEGSVSSIYTISKGSAIYYELGTNVIKGLNYRMPVVNTGDPQSEYAIKRILGKVFGLSNNVWKDIKVNDFVFHVVYRTKDTLRADQSRPDLRKYLLNSKYDRVPQHNQFNNQTDIVVDSEKFGNNIYGKLIRTGNTSYTVTEWVDSLNGLKKVGNLFLINKERYYVAKVTNWYFGDHVISKVEYSKDYNQLSQIIGIPSEPRFYEISEQSLIQREKPFNDYIVLGTSIKSQSNSTCTIRAEGWGYIGNLLLGNETAFPKYAISVFKNDSDRKYGSIVGNENFYKEICLPISTYSIENVLTLEWDCADNFSAGDEVVATDKSKEPAWTIDTAYNTLLPVQYVDGFGRADLIDFMLLKDIPNMSADAIRALPNSPLRTRNAYQIVGTQEEIGQEMLKPHLDTIKDQYLFGNEGFDTMGDNQHGKVLLLDNREWFCGNYNLHLITDSDRFVVSAYMWQPSKKTLRLALLNEEVNKISTGTISGNSVLNSLPLKYSVDKEHGVITIKIKESLGDTNLKNIKALAVIDDTDTSETMLHGAKYFVFARNISDIVGSDEAIADWYISAYDKSMFPHQ